MCVLSRGKNVAREGKLRDGGNAGCYSQVVGPLLREWAGGPRSGPLGTLLIYMEPSTMY